MALPATPLPALTHEESKSYMAAPLLPDPGCEVVRQHLQTISQLRMDMANLTGLLNMSGKSPVDQQVSLDLALGIAVHHAKAAGAVR